MPVKRIPVFLTVCSHIVLVSKLGEGVRGVAQGQSICLACLWPWTHPQQCTVSKSVSKQTQKQTFRRIDAMLSGHEDQ